MGLDLQLHRIVKLLELLNNPHHVPKFIHVAGTNGKGSVCSYISHVLTQSGITNGKFNSPHLITARDSIQIDNIPVSQSVYDNCKKLILDIDEKHRVGCTEFEILTCTAFQIFADLKIPIAIMEVGLGGRNDATNVIPPENTLAVGITKIGLDHQNLLGKTLAEIAFQKVGIFKKNVPAVIDGSNSESVLNVAKSEAANVECPLYLSKRDKDCWISPKLLGDYQWDNLAVALNILKILQKEEKKIDNESIEEGIKNTIWPGRLQEYNFDVGKLGLTDNNNSSVTILLDGAHNTQASIELGKYLNTIRKDRDFIYVIAITKGKMLNTLFKPIINSKDTIIFTQFNDNIEGMPWIEPTPVETLVSEVKSQGIKYSDMYAFGELKTALTKACELSQETGKKIVVCGSLYLVADVLRM